jgi:RHS repeat-associated protein
MSGGELQSMQYRQGNGSQYFTENRAYNNRAQLKELSSSSGPSRMDLQYVYNIGANNGQVAQMNDVVSGEQTVYTYDSLKRLIKAEASVTLWGQSFGYDGFGNLISKTPTAGHTGTGMMLAVNSSNQVGPGQGFTYDANGNMTSFPTTSGTVNLGYDVENRTGGSWYDTANQPLNRAGTWNSYGLRGERLETVSLGYGEQTVFGQLSVYGTITQTSQNIYFAGRMIQTNGVTVATDRLGSVRLDQNGNKTEYYPYGEVVSGTTSGDLFGTYTRESATGLDYANQRYYSSVYGRFTSPDRYTGSAGPRVPLSWNRYAYVLGDPINGTDRTGAHVDCDDDSCDESDCGGDPISCLMAGSGGNSGGGGACDSLLSTGLGCDPVIATATACATPGQQFLNGMCDVPIYQSPLITGMFTQVGTNLQGADALIGAATAPYILAAGASAISGLTAAGMTGAATAAAGTASPQGQQALQTMTSVLEYGINETTQTIAGYQLAGNQGLVGSTYNMNIWGLYATEGAQGLFSLVNGLNSLASSSGASQISILGTQIINSGLANMNPGVAARVGLTLTQINSTTILLQGPVH